MEWSTSVATPRTTTAGPAPHDLPDWTYAHCLPYFKKSETREKGGDDYRGGEGPLRVHTGECKNPLYNAFIEAGQQAGYPYTADMNGHQREGFGPMDMTTYKGRRWSTAMAYLCPAIKRGNVMLQPNTLASRILFEGKDQPRAVGVEVDQNGQKVVFRARREVILSGGAINSPQLLQLSGIGNAGSAQTIGHPCGGGSQGRRRKPAGPHGNLRAVRVQGTHHAVLRYQTAEDGSHRC